MGGKLRKEGIYIYTHIYIYSYELFTLLHSRNQYILKQIILQLKIIIVTKIKKKLPWGNLRPETPRV